MKKICLSLALLLLLMAGCKTAKDKTLTCIWDGGDVTVDYSFVGEKPVKTIVLKAVADYTYYGFTSIEEFEENKEEFTEVFGTYFYTRGGGEVEVYAEGDNIVGILTIAGADFDFSVVIDETDVNKVTFAMLQESAEASGLTCEIQ